MKSIRIINEFLAEGYTNVDWKDVEKAINELSENLPSGDTGKYVLEKLNKLRSSANEIWILRTDKYWESFLQSEYFKSTKY